MRHLAVLSVLLASVTLVPSAFAQSAGEVIRDIGDAVGDAVDDFFDPPRIVDIAPGMTSPEVRRAQFYLNELGFSAGKVDGVPGRQTSRAIAAWQRDFGHPVTGTLNRSRLAQLARDHREAQNTPAPVPEPTPDEAPTDMVPAAEGENAPNAGAMDTEPAEPEQSDGDTLRETLRYVQVQLTELGYAPGRTDGVWDPASRRAMTAFRSDYALPDPPNLTAEDIAALAKAVAAPEVPAETR